MQGPSEYHAFTEVKVEKEESRPPLHHHIPADPVVPSPHEAGEEDEERHDLNLEDMDDLEENEFNISESAGSSSQSVPIRSKENKLINKSQPFPSPSEFYLYSPLGKIDKCMQCREVFTTSYMLASHIEKVHPKQTKHPKPVPAATPSVRILPSCEFQGPSALPVKRPRGRPPRKPLPTLPNSQPPSQATSKQETDPKRRKTEHDNNYSNNNNSNNAQYYNSYSYNSNNNNYNYSSYSKTYEATVHSINGTTKHHPPPPSSSSSSDIHEEKLFDKMNPNSVHTSDLARQNVDPNKTPSGSNPAQKNLSLDILAQKIENLSMLRKIADQGLISEQQYKQKQEEFLQSVSFV